MKHRPRSYPRSEVALPIVVSDAMRRVMDRAERVAATSTSSALILGESGAGKEIVAEHIHRCSSRHDQPFVRVNLAAFPDGVVDSELFGCVRGAFTGATRARDGLIASANKGTLLLDELCDFRVELQPKLLRVLEERRYFPLGSDRERSVDVRILAATNQDPEEAIRNGRLRRDLFYRLTACVISVPPLRQRSDDIIPLMTYFLDCLAKEVGGLAPELPRAVVQALLSHAWPGNVRELRNVAQRIIMLAEGATVTESMLDLHGSAGTKAPGEERARASATSTGEPSRNLRQLRSAAIASLEKARIEQALRECGGSRSETARRLGVAKSTLWIRMKRYGITHV